MLLDEKLKVLGQLRILDDHGLAKKRTVLGASDPEDVSQLKNIIKSQVILGRREGATDTRTINKEEQSILLAESLDGRQLRLGIHGANLGGVGNVHQARLGHVWEVPVVVEGLGDGRRRQLAIFRHDIDDLMAARLDCTRLSRDNVAGAGSNDCLVRTETGGDGNSIGRRAAGNEKYADVLASEMIADVMFGLLAKGVAAVSYFLAAIALEQGG